MPITVLGSVGSFIKKTMSAGATGASALDYGMKELETQAFLMNARSQASALSDASTLSVLQNYLITENDSENIQKLVALAKLQNQTQPIAITANNLIRH